MKSIKKFSTAALLAMSMTVTPEAWADTSAFVAPTCGWAANAPDQHRVQRGDTLWDLASIFLKNPWCWPRVWQANQNLIRDPHWIYPGQVIVLDRARGVLRLDDDRESGLQFTHLSPRMRAEAADESPIPLLSRQLQTLLSRSPLLSAAELADAPAVTGLPEQRSMAGEGDTVLVRGDLGTATQFDVVRPMQAIRDPDSGELLGMAGLRTGRVRLASRGQLLHRFLVTSSSSELRLGDKLMHVVSASPAPVSPHPSTASVGKLAAILHEGRWAALHDLVALNIGARDGLDTGGVVRVARLVRQVRIGNHETLPSQPSPEDAQSIALLLVFQVAERMSLAFVMRARDAITVGDAVLPPETSPQ